MFKLTPDLSQSFHPCPKPNAKVKKQAKPLGPGKKTQEWTVERKELIEEFEALGINSCELKLEGCWGKQGLGFAHRNKRRNLTREDLGQVVLLCNSCHGEIELLNNVRMMKIIDKIIKDRNSKL